MDDDLTVRTATRADAAGLLALIRDAYRGEGSRRGWTTEADLLDDERIDLAGVTARIERANGTMLIALASERDPIGCCEIDYHGDGVAYFGLFAVSPQRQDAGIGRTVLAAAERFAQRKWQATTMEMTVIAQREELIAWYQRRGYRPTGETRPFPYEQLVNGPALRDDLYFTVLSKRLPADTTDPISVSS